MPETRSNEIEVEEPEALNDWAVDKAERGKVFAHAKQLGIRLDCPETYVSVFSVDLLREFPGTVEDALQALTDWAIAREEALRDRIPHETPDHREAMAIAWTYMIAPDGTQINVTAREGATANSVTATVLALTGSIRMLGELGFVTQKARK